ncbi:ribonuclease P protein component [[Synechococcus] sp. NIES-970]|uniref:ribonuclease P protein component n=1 Tax=Picosynechococcus sp. NKBG15041c TaxID=1407650 RepID=UPI000425BE91|nr:ribonuclease P protein component [Picosynechococcus sp. NKBG15041c]BAW96089.1 ribonuclease P protein component [[Synechococcus] sp. NIES-970]
MGLPKVHRLKHWRDFKTIYSQGKRFRGNTLAIILLPQATAPTQVGISISRKVSKKAVVRNLIKRRIRHACRTLLPSLEPGWQIIIAVRYGATECEYEHFLQELKRLLIQAEVFHGH